jgi:hypothetical protein
MLKTMKKLNKLTNAVDFNLLWDGFSKTKYAVYNDKIFYVNDNRGLNIYLKKDEFGFIGNVDERFMGNTAIKINNEYVAIWDQRTISAGMDDAKLASVMIHEMFHCFQASYGEKRYGNEILGIEYPIEKENIALRSHERQYLYDAVFENNKHKKNELLIRYFSIRNKREKLYGNVIDYEKGIESFEGTAVFVEFQALCRLNTNKNRFDLLRDYLKGFTEINISNLAIRRSSYNQGMVLCMIADDLLLDWKQKYQKSDLYLSDFILNELKIEIEVSDENLSLSNEVDACLQDWKKQRDLIFSNFENKPDKIVVNSGVQMTGFDPMNIIKRDKEIMHQSFLRVILDNKEQIIAGPVKTIIGEHIFDIKKMEWLGEKNIS